MGSSVQTKPALSVIHARATLFLHSLAFERVALGIIFLLAAGLRLANLSALGYVNHYYTAAVTSMLQSWHNFFFVAAEPGASVTVDKPPLGLWLQALSAKVLGVNTLGVLLPQILAGMLSIALLYFLVRRSFGSLAGLTAALALAITPVVVAADRNNTIDSTLILILLLSAWAFIRAAESAKLRYLLLGAALVGMGFNVKMLAACLPLPAFVALYFWGAPEKLGPKLGKLALAGLVLLGVSLSWVTLVDLTPTDQRPYIGSSGDNTETSLILGYNGVERLTGLFGRQIGNRSGFPTGNFSPSAPGPQPGFQAGRPAGRSFGANPPANRPGLGIPGSGRNTTQAPVVSGASNVGQVGWLRLFLPPLSKEASWLLPLALLGAVLAAMGARLRWPLAPQHQALVLWGGWLVTAGIFFSIANFFHEYYLSILGAPLAALAGIGAGQLWRLSRQRAHLAAAMMLVLSGGTLAYQVYTAQAFVRDVWWLPLAAAFLFASVILLFIGTWWQPQVRFAAAAGAACALLAVLITPGVWSSLTMQYPSANQSLPAAFDGQTYGPPNRGQLQIDSDLLAYLQTNTTDNTYLMAVPSSMQGSDYVIATGRPVLYLGGFMGIDQVVTPQQLSAMVAGGELRYVYWNTGSDRSEVSAWVAANCTLVPGFETSTRNQGAPDGTALPGNGTAQGMGGFQVGLYQCN
ncbi:MAG: glycosyltransferase family 39 protein [Anaerolineaceae bacterium]|nr:glycosyltransferase family 39 protein [Anaerolineaceae bacterium]